MPQATNQRLVSQMAAVPTGRGSVYNALLKARAVNRERAAVVNSSERQRLEKINRSIDKDLRHTAWRADQTINRIKGSLNKLLAYQKVLKEDFPCKQLCPILPSGTLSGKPSNKPSVKNRILSERGSNSNDISEWEKPDGSSRRSKKSAAIDINDFHTHNIDKVSAANRRVQFEDRGIETTGAEVESTKKHSLKSKYRSDVEDTKFSNSGDVSDEEEDNESRRKKDSVVEHGRYRRIGQVPNGEESLKEVEEDETLVSSRLHVVDIRRKLLPLRENIDEHRTSKAEFMKEETPAAAYHAINQREKLRKKEHDEEDNSHPTYKNTQLIPSSQKQLSVKKKEDNNHASLSRPRLCVFDTPEESQMKGPLTDAQREWHKKRIKRKDTVTQRIYTRGFDMRTLAWEIDRKLVVMDSAYARQRERRQLVKESKEDVERLVTRNQTAFTSKVMTASKTTR